MRSIYVKRDSGIVEKVGELYIKYKRVRKGQCRKDEEKLNDMLYS